jgi:cytochrome P450
VQAIFGGENVASIRQLLALSREAVKCSSPILFFSPKMHFRFLGLSPWDRFRKAQTRLRNAFAAELERRRREPAEREDILTLLTNARYEDGSPIELEHAQDELGTFLFAGHETSALAMAWAFYHLHRHPQTLQALRDELVGVNATAPEELVKLPYLKAVVQETLRLHPIVTEVLRVLKSPMQLGAFTIPAGVAVAPATVLAHYRADTFPEPDAFRPKRFLEHSYSSSEYFPFGGGQRRCAGAAFAMYEMAIVLGTLLSRYEFELLEKKELHPIRRNITMGPSSGVLMRVRRMLSGSGRG